MPYHFYKKKNKLLRNFMHLDKRNTNTLAQ